MFTRCLERCSWGWIWIEMETWIRTRSHRRLRGSWEHECRHLIYWSIHQLTLKRHFTAEAQKWTSPWHQRRCNYTLKTEGFILWRPWTSEKSLVTMHLKRWKKRKRISVHPPGTINDVCTKRDPSSAAGSSQTCVGWFHNFMDWLDIVSSFIHIITHFIINHSLR